MPYYNMKLIETGEVTEMLISRTEKDELVASGKYQTLLGFPKIVSCVGSLHSRVPDGFKDKLKEMKKARGRPAAHMPIVGDWH